MNPSERWNEPPLSFCAKGSLVGSKVMPTAAASTLLMRTTNSVTLASKETHANSVNNPHDIFQNLSVCISVVRICPHENKDGNNGVSLCRRLCGLYGHLVALFSYPCPVSCGPQLNYSPYGALCGSKTVTGVSVSACISLCSTGANGTAAAATVSPGSTITAWRPSAASTPPIA